MSTAIGDVEDVTNAGYLALIIAGLALVAYIGYELYQGTSSLGTSITNLGCSIFGISCSNSQSSDPTAANYVEPYSAAAATVASDPIGSVGSIIGLDQGNLISDSTAQAYSQPGVGP